MYIQEVRLQNFRAFGSEGVNFTFSKGINAVIGENNNGKTALIDAIRIAFSCALYKKDIFFSRTDFHVNAAGEKAASAQIDIYLKDVPRNLIEIWDPLQPDCGEFHVIFTLDKTPAGADKVKYRAWGGKCEGNTYSSVHGVKGESFDAILLYIPGTRGSTLTPSFLASGDTNTELMRIAYVAMTRPRKLLAVAMPKNSVNLSVRFPPSTWDYIEL